MYLTAQQRTMLESTLINLRYYMDCIGLEAEINAEIAALTDAELETIINDYLSDL